MYLIEHPLLRELSYVTL